MISSRDNNTWLRDLRAGGAQGDAALADLRVLLLRALPHALSKWLSLDSPEFESFFETTTHETLLRVLDSLDTFQGRSQFTTWVYKISVRVALNELRRRWEDGSMAGLECDETDESMPP